MRLESGLDSSDGTFMMYEPRTRTVPRNTVASLEFVALQKQRTTYLSLQEEESSIRIFG